MGMEEVRRLWPRGSVYALLLPLFLLPGKSGLAQRDLVGTFGFNPNVDFLEVGVCGREPVLADLVGERVVRLVGPAGAVVLDGRRNEIRAEAGLVSGTIGGAGGMDLEVGVQALALGMHAEGWRGGEETRHFFSVTSQVDDWTIRVELDYSPAELTGGAPRRIFGGIPLQSRSATAYLLDQESGEELWRASLEVPGSSDTPTLSIRPEALPGSPESVESHLSLTAAAIELDRGRKTKAGRLIEGHRRLRGMTREQAGQVLKTLEFEVEAKRGRPQGIDLSVAKLIDALSWSGGGLVGLSTVEVASARWTQLLTDSVEPKVPPHATLLPQDEVILSAIAIAATQRMDDVAFTIEPDYAPEEIAPRLRAAVRQRAASGTEGVFRVGGLGHKDVPTYLGADFRGTAVGEIAVRADLALKSLFVGVDYWDGREVFLDSAHRELVMARALSNSEAHYSRIWFRPERIEVRSSDGLDMVDVQIGARMMQIRDDGSGRLEDVGPTRPEAQAVADYITSNYERASAIYPVLRDLKTVYTTLAVVELARQRGYDVDALWGLAERQVEHDYFDPHALDGFSVGYVVRTGPTTGLLTGVVGGVELGHRGRSIQQRQRVRSADIPSSVRPLVLVRPQP